MNDKNIPPSVGEFAVEERAKLLARIAQLEADNLALGDRNAAVEDGLARNLDYRTAYREAMAELAALKQPSAGADEWAALRYTSDGELAECPCCGSLDVGGANGTVSCYGCELQITKPRPLQNAADAWNKRARLNASRDVPEGWRLVPVEPTDAMCEVGHIGVDVCTGIATVYDDNYYSICGIDAANVYHAMLAAAPVTAPAPASAGHSEDARHMVGDVVQVPRELAARIADPFTSTSSLIENLRDLRALLNGGRDAN